MNRLPNYHVLIVKTLGATNTKPARIKITSERFEQSVIIPFTNEVDSISPTLESAELWLTKNRHKVIGHGEGKDHYYVICEAVNGSFSVLKPIK